MIQTLLYWSYKVMMATKCWICRSKNIKNIKQSNLSDKISLQSYFKISDRNYGVTGTLFKCDKCGFIQCLDFANTDEIYQANIDPEYEQSRNARRKQMQEILKFAQRKMGTFESLLDIGAGSGILLEVAGEYGFRAVGIESSNSLVAIAKKYSLKVEQGTFPDTKIKGRFDLITLIDVIEHVNNPSHLIESLGKNLNDKGVVVISTPDVLSKMARIMRYNWWHFRVAHVGYFDLNTLNLLMINHGYVNIGHARPAWFMPANYLLSRLFRILIRKNFNYKLGKSGWGSSLIVRFNLHDSILCAYRKI